MRIHIERAIGLTKHTLQCWALQYPSNTITMQCTRYNAGHYNTQAARLRCNAHVTMLGTTIPKQHDYDAMHKLQCWALQYPGSTITMQCTSYNAGHYNIQAARLRCNAQVTMLGTTIPRQHDYDAMHKLQCWALQYPSSTITMQCTSYNAGHYNTQAARLRCNAQVTMLGTTIPKQNDYYAMHKFTSVAPDHLVNTRGRSVESVVQWMCKPIQVKRPVCRHLLCIARLRKHNGKIFLWFPTWQRPIRW